ncbi:MAG: hypothetical protein GVY36_17195 [Verrucomicrobia bacterium]|jgi:hypothetical protein|nr:hypothetical protein [Verrucomicrobiota bacterium]
MVPKMATLLLAFVAIPCASSSPITEAADDVIAELDSQSKAILVETPRSWVYSVSSSGLAPQIRNVIGTWPGTKGSEDVQRSCRLIDSQYTGDDFSHFCASMILYEVIHILRNEIPAETRLALDRQESTITEASISLTDSESRKALHIEEVVKAMNDALRRYGSTLKVEVHRSFFEIGDRAKGKWEPYLSYALPGKESVSHVLSRISLALGACVRRSNGEIWIGGECRLYDGVNSVFE